MPILSRRTFLHQASVASAAALVPATLRINTAAEKQWRAAVIGATGRGNYGHDLDRAFQGVPGIQVAAVADPDSAGRARAAARAGAPRQYAGYREMLDEEKPELVIVAPRWSESHFEMARAALQQGAHLLCEKPFTTTLAEADTLLATAKQAHRKIAVAHQMRLAPNIVHLRQAIADGLIGELVHFRSWGKQDARAGGEDMIVLGTHVFDMIRLFAGDAISCGAHVSQHGHTITRADIRQATEKIGPVAGDEIEAHYLFGHGVTASFTSRGRLRETLGPWAVELQGSKGAVRILMDIDPIVLHRQRRGAPTSALIEEWQAWPHDPPLRPSPDQRGFAAANRRVVQDWLSAIAEDREPQCSGANANKALEFVMAAFQSALTGARVEMPLKTREHPLS